MVSGLVFDRAGEAAVYGVVLGDIRQLIRSFIRGVDADDFHIAAGDGGSEDQASYAAEAIDSYFNTHASPSIEFVKSHCLI